MDSNNTEETQKPTGTQQKIIETAIRLIQEEGYSDISSRQIARETGISVGTLYYHFKHGKTEILALATKQMIEYLKIDEILSDGKVTDEEIRQFFYRDLDIARKMKPFLIATEIELLSHPDEYTKKAEFYLVDKSLDPFKRLFEGIAGKELSNDTFKKIILVFKIFIRRHVIFRNLYGSDDEFIEMMKKIIVSLA